MEVGDPVADEASWTEDDEKEEAKEDQEEEEEEKTDEEGKSKARSSGAAEPPAAEPLGELLKVKQKAADLSWWIGGVHQIVVWVGTARSGKKARARGMARTTN